MKQLYRAHVLVHKGTHSVLHSCLICASLLYSWKFLKKKGDRGICLTTPHVSTTSCKHEVQSQSNSSNQNSTFNYSNQNNPSSWKSDGSGFCIRSSCNSFTLLFSYTSWPLPLQTFWLLLAGRTQQVLPITQTMPLLFTCPCKICKCDSRSTCISAQPWNEIREVERSYC